MTSSDVSINPYIYEHQALPELEQAFKDAKLPIQPKRIGYRLLEDHFGNDVIEFKIVLPQRIEFTSETISPEQSGKLLRILNLWQADYFPNYSTMVSF